MYKSISQVIVLIFSSLLGYSQQSVSATYTAGNISTSYNQYDPLCNGPTTVLEILIPQGPQVEITNVHITYSMTAAAGGWISDQRSKVRCSTLNVEEFEASAGQTYAGTFMYERDVSDFNGIVNGGDVLVFEMWAYRTYEGDHILCNDLVNRVDNNTWTITVEYGEPVISEEPHNLGINTTDPVATLDVAGKIRVGDDENPPHAGMIRWNEERSQFEGYNGSQWITFGCTPNGGWGMHMDSPSKENQHYQPEEFQNSDLFGAAISINDSLLCIGAPDYLIAGVDGVVNGVINTLKRENGQWVEADQLGVYNTFESSNDDVFEFGRALDVSGSRMIVGSRDRVFIYGRVGGSWVEEAVFFSPDPGEYFSYGTSVNIDGEFAIVSATLEDYWGRVYIYRNNGGVWSLLQELTHPSPSGEFNQFGATVHLNGNQLAIGSPTKDTEGHIWAGDVLTYTFNGTIWEQVQIIVPPDLGEYIQFGSSVFIDANYLYVGTPGAGENGVVYQYTLNGGIWDLEQQIEPPSGAGMDPGGFGESVDVHGNAIVIGASTSNTQRGLIFVYEKSGPAIQMVGSLIASDSAEGDRFGYIVKMNANTIAGGYFLDGFVSKGVKIFGK